MVASMCRLPRCQGFRAAPGAAPPLPRPVHRTRAAPAAPRAAGDKLIDPSAGGRRLVATLPPCDPATMCDLRTAEAFGPRGMLLVGFSQQDAAAVQQRLDAIEPGFVAAPCPAALLGDGTLGGALGDGAAVPQHAWEAAPAGTPPVAFFSGMSGEEQVALMEAWGEATGLDAVPAFASVVPGLLERPLHRLVSDVVRVQAQQAPPAGQPAGAAAAASEGLASKLSEFVMLDGEGQPQGQAVDMDALREQIREKMRQKKAAQAAAEKAARREAAADETDRLQQALRSGKKGGKAKKGGGGGGGKPKGFGS